MDKFEMNFQFVFGMLLLLFLATSSSDGSNQAEENSIEHPTRSSHVIHQAGGTNNANGAQANADNTFENSLESSAEGPVNSTFFETPNKVNNESSENSMRSLGSSESTGNTSIENLPNLTMSTEESPTSQPFYQREGPICDSNTDCNITNMERCEPAGGEIHRCECISGHSRARDGRSCIAIKMYLVELETSQPLDMELDDPSTSAFRQFLYALREVAINSIKLSKLGPIFVDADVSQLSATPPGTVLVHYEVKLQRSYVPDVAVVKVDMKQGFIGQLSATQNGTVFYESTSIPGEVRHVDDLLVRDTNPCTNPELNYCDDNALCLTSVRSFICRCKRGFEDVSVDQLEAPGEKCIPTCGCRNGAECYLDDNERPKCRCPQWYLGEACNIDGRLLLIALAGVLAGMLLLSMACCICCIRYWKRRYRTKDELSSIYSLPREHIHAHKLPSGGRSWYDTWRYYSFSPPNYNSAAGPGSMPSKGPAHAGNHRSHYPPVMAYRRSSEMASPPIELMPQGYSGPYVAIPRPHVLPSSRPGTSSQPRSNTHWFWSTTDSSYA